MNGINDWSVESELLIRVENHPLKIGTDDWLMHVCFMPLIVSGKVIYEDALCLCSHATPLAFRKQTPLYIHTIFAIPFWPAHIAESVLEEERSESLSNIFESAIDRIIGDKPRVA